MKIAIIGLGYVGLPLAVEFGKIYNTVGYDINSSRISQLRNSEDITLEVTPKQINESTSLRFTSCMSDISDCNVYIVTVPTPIDEAKTPDLGPLIAAASDVGSILNKGDIVIFESTVYPGATEEVCVPILEKQSGLHFNADFGVGYSPERINPGDRVNTLTKIKKVTSGSSAIYAEQVNTLYKSIIEAGTHLASSIKVAEAAKVIENTQRDINIGLINELSLIFERLGIDTAEVLEAAGTKWNFLPFRPGLVGGHCIGVDPYYLTHKAQSVGYYPEVILAARRLNDNMSANVASRLIHKMLQSNMDIRNARVLVLGFTFKEDCPDIRNTKVVDVVKELKKFNIEVDIVDPNVDAESALKHYELTVNNKLSSKNYDAILLAVPHREFIEAGANSIKSYGKSNAVFFDLKSVFDASNSDLRL
jgi:UDP-N-acetyl-D-glucosamine/UDP-N-acetyl-D-galactosamine dehydrogenase